jgi:hypothetical protein
VGSTHPCRIDGCGLAQSECLSHGFDCAPNIEPVCSLRHLAAIDLADEEGFPPSTSRTGVLKRYPPLCR